MRICSFEITERTDDTFVVVVGTFDGVHLGHKSLLTTARRVAESTGAKVGVFVIEGGPDSRSRNVTGLEHRLELLAGTGLVDTAWMVPRTIHDDPIEVLGDALDAVRVSALVVSRHLNLGRPGRLTSDDFAALCRLRRIDLVGFEAGESDAEASVGALFTVGNLVELLDAGHLAEAGWLLGRLYEMRGIVEHGDQRGRTIGVPTANVGIEPSFVIPEEGVYAGVTILDDGAIHPTAISLGRRSTFYEAGWELLEAHLLDFDGDLYGRTIRVLFTEKLRDQRKFASIHELAAQLRIDIGCTRSIDPVARYQASRTWWADTDPDMLTAGATA